MTAPAPPLPPGAALRVYRTMATIRAAESRITAGLASGELAMTYYPVRGQEAISAALSEHLRPDDHMVTTYRCLHDCIAKGASLDELVAEMCGKSTGTSKGKGGPMHLSDPGVGLMVTSGVVGGAVPIANGLALAAQLRGTDQVTVANFGDGATSIGATHEAANLAAVWDLPVIFVCQHNQYGEHTAFADYTRTGRLAERFATYGMAAVTVDGNSVPEVYAAAGEAIPRARAGGGPTFLECLTHRLDGHTFGAPTGYMDQQRLAAATAAEPVASYRRWLVTEGGVAEHYLAELEAEAAAAVETALRRAAEAPAPGPEELQADVFADASAVPW